MIKGVAVQKREEFLPLSLPTIGEEEIKAVTEVLKSRWITTGSKTMEFEKQFADFVGVKYAVALTSGTAGMHLLLHSLGLSPTDEILTPALTFASTINQIVLNGAKPIFVDVEYDTMLMDIEDLKRKVTKNTKAVIPVHFAGQAADLDAIEEVVGEKILIIEDCAHSIGTYYKGKHTGSKNTGIFSFHPIKNITTAEGGMITTNDENLAKRIRSLRFHGIKRDAYSRYMRKTSPKYDIEEPGFKYNMPDLLAAIGIQQLKRLSDFNEKRKRLAEIYYENLRGIDEIDLPGMAKYDTNHSFHLFVVKVRSVNSEDFIEKLHAYNVGAGLHFPAAHDFSYIVKKYGKTSLKNTDKLKDKIVSLPLFPDMREEDVLYVCEAIKEILS